MGLDDGHVFPVVVRVGIGRNVSRFPDRHAGRQVVDEVVLNQTVEPQQVEPPIDGDDLGGPQTVVGLEPVSGPRRAELLPAAPEVTPDADRRLRAERSGDVEDPAVVDEVEASVAHGDEVRQSVGAVRQRQNNQRRSPIRDEAAALRPFEPEGDIGRRKGRRGVNVDVLAQRS